MADATARPTRCPFLFVREAEVLIGACKPTLLDWARRGAFPAPLRIGRRLAWRREDVEEWLARQAEAAQPGRSP